jgi:hypothetical protein
MIAQATAARLDASGRQVVTVTVGHGYRPASIVALAWAPLRIVFRREDDESCSERVVFSSPHLERRLSPTGETAVDLPAQAPGEVRFTCGMGRYRGHILLVEALGPAALSGPRAAARRLRRPIGTAIVGWFATLPVIVLVAILAADPVAAMAASFIALFAWIAVCLSASRGSVRPA